VLCPYKRWYLNILKPLWQLLHCVNPSVQSSAHRMTLVFTMSGDACSNHVFNYRPSTTANWITIRLFAFVGTRRFALLKVLRHIVLGTSSLLMVSSAQMRPPLTFSCPMSLGLSIRSFLKVRTDSEYSALHLLLLLLLLLLLKVMYCAAKLIIGRKQIFILINNVSTGVKETILNSKCCHFFYCCPICLHKNWSAS